MGAIILGLFIFFVLKFLFPAFAIVLQLFTGVSEIFVDGMNKVVAQ